VWIVVVLADESDDGAARNAEGDVPHRVNRPATHARAEGLREFGDVDDGFVHESGLPERLDAGILRDVVIRCQDHEGFLQGEASLLPP
jgi:hypothetical protein